MARIPNRLPGREIEEFEDKVILSNSADKQGELTIYGGTSGEKALSIYNGSTLLVSFDATGSGEMNYVDNASARFGTGEDLKFYHDGTNSYIDNATGDIYIRGTASGVDILLQPNNDTSDYLTISTLSDVPTIFGTGAYVRIGDAATTSHTLASEDDLMVTGKLEVLGASYADGSLNLDRASGADSFLFTVATLTYFAINNLTDDGTHFCTVDTDGRTNRNFIFTTFTNRAKNHDHSTLSVNPTLFVHSATDPDTANTQWISLTHDQTNGVINTGTGTLKLASSSMWTANGTATVTISNVAPAGVGTATISQWLTLVDSAGTTYYIPAWT